MFLHETAHKSRYPPCCRTEPAHLGKTMNKAGKPVKLHSHTCALEPRCICLAFVPEDILAGGEDQSRRESRKIRCQQRRYSGVKALFLRRQIPVTLPEGQTPDLVPGLRVRPLSAQAGMILTTCLQA